jgi:hypothetical protein
MSGSGSTHPGRAGPRSFVRVVGAPASSSRSSSVSIKSPATNHSATYCGARAPTIAPVTPGQAKVQAMATASTVAEMGVGWGAPGFSRGEAEPHSSRRGDHQTALWLATYCLIISSGAQFLGPPAVVAASADYRS